MDSYVTFDAAGNLTGSYLQEISPEHYQNYILVDANVRANWPLYRANSLHDGVELLPPPAVNLESIKSTLVSQIDAAIADIYSRFLRFSAEYNEREAAARAFKAAGYQGDPGVWVSAFASAAGMPAVDATNLIISQADNLKNALKQLGALRMQKYLIIRAPDQAVANQEYASIMSSISTIAAGLT